jgi:hypothetical protein
VVGNGLTETGVALHVGTLPQEPATVWCEDRFAKSDERFLTREAVTMVVPAAEKIVVVVDGSLAMAGAKGWLTKSLGSIDAGKLTLILADDHARRVTAGRRWRVPKEIFENFSMACWAGGKNGRGTGSARPPRTASRETRFGIS